MSHTADWSSSIRLYQRTHGTSDSVLPERARPASDTVQYRDEEEQTGDLGRFGPGLHPNSTFAMARPLGDAEEPGTYGRMGVNGLLQERLQLLAGVAHADHEEGERRRGDADGGEVRGQSGEAQSATDGRMINSNVYIEGHTP